MPNDQKTVKSDDSQTPTSNVPPVLIQEDVLPPMPQQTSQPSTANSEQPKTDVINTSPVDSGSGAPENDIKIDTVMPAVVTSGPKKKFAGGKVIATILGLFLLVGGIGAGVFLTGQNQNINEQAGARCSNNQSQSSCTSSCSPIKADGKSYKCTWYSQSSSCGESGQECGGGGGGTDPNIPDCTQGQVNSAGLGGSWQYKCTNLGSSSCQKGSGGNNTGYKCTCIDMSPSGVCKFYANNCNTYDPSNCPLGENPPPGSNYCSGTGCSVPVLQAGCYVSHFRSDKKDDPVVNGSDTTVNLTAKSAQLGGVSCGAEQIDVNCDYGSGYPDCTVAGAHQTGACSVSRRYDVDCGTTNPTVPPTVPPTTPPTAPPTTPGITAYCQNIKAYSSTWTELTAAQLTALRAGNTVNFCVTGSASSGSFDKAKFTINGIVQAETTTKRPGAEDFCQSYTIPANTLSFVITAQINHVKLGWK